MPGVARAQDGSGCAERRRMAAVEVPGLAEIRFNKEQR